LHPPLPLHRIHPRHKWWGILREFHKRKDDKKDKNLLSESHGMAKVLLVVKKLSPQHVVLAEIGFVLPPKIVSALA
jgi:hypothetical protein